MPHWSSSANNSTWTGNSRYKQAHGGSGRQAGSWATIAPALASLASQSGWSLVLAIRALQKGYRTVQWPVWENIRGEIQHFNEVLQIILSSENHHFSIPRGDEAEGETPMVDDIYHAQSRKQGVNSSVLHRNATWQIRKQRSWAPLKSMTDLSWAAFIMSSFIAYLCSLQITSLGLSVPWGTRSRAQWILSTSMVSSVASPRICRKRPYTVGSKCEGLVLLQADLIYGYSGDSLYFCGQKACLGGSSGPHHGAWYDLE